jgi:hypothetical protein
LPADVAPCPRTEGSSVEEIEFYVVAEAGILEAQAILLCESIRLFAGRYATAAITVVSPRADRRPSPASLKRLAALGADYLALEVESCCAEYSTAIRVHVTPIVVRRPGPAILVQLDSDTLFLGEPDLALAGADIAARPADLKTICTGGAGDPMDGYWRRLCALCGVDYDLIPTVVTTVDQAPIRAAYNGGLIAVRRDCGVFERTEANFLRLIAANLRPRPGTDLRFDTGTGIVAGRGAEFWGTTQAAFSLAAAAGRHPVRILPASHNLPLNLFDDIAAPAVPPIHVHYHWLANAGRVQRNPLLDGRLHLPPAARAWLADRLPLTPPA